MMSMRSIVLALVIVALMAVPAMGATATAIPTIVKIPLGGYSTTTLYINLTPSDPLNVNHYVTLTVLNASTLKSSDKLNISVLGYTTYKTGVGAYTFVFKPNTAGVYTFTVNLSTNLTNLPNLNDQFIIQVQDMVINTSVIPPIKVVTATVFGSTIVPELSTLALGALGIAAVLLARRFM